MISTTVKTTKAVSLVLLFFIVATVSDACPSNRFLFARKWRPGKTCVRTTHRRNGWKTYCSKVGSGYAEARKTVGLLVRFIAKPHEKVRMFHASESLKRAKAHFNTCNKIGQRWKNSDADWYCWQAGCYMDKIRSYVEDKPYDIRFAALAIKTLRDRFGI